jgi:hypothetical protein
MLITSTSQTLKSIIRQLETMYTVSFFYSKFIWKSQLEPHSFQVDTITYDTSEQLVDKTNLTIKFTQLWNM